MVKDVGYRTVMWFVYVVPSEKLEYGTTIAWDDDSFRNMTNHCNMCKLHDYTEHKVDIPQNADYESNDDVLKIDCESRVGTRVTGGLAGSVAGETSNAEGLGFIFRKKYADANESDDDAKIQKIEEDCMHFFKKRGKLSNDEVETETCFDFDFGTSSETNKGNKGTKSLERDDEFERQQDFDMDDESGRETDDIDSLGVGSYESLDDEEDVLSKFDMAKRLDFKLVQNEKDKISAKYKGDGCPWVIYASIDNSDGFFKVKKLVSQHECSITFKNSRANYKLVGNHFLKKLRIIPKLTLLEMKRLAKEELNVDIPIGLCSKARIWVMDKIDGRVHYEFNRLFDYATALR
ncbi:hypothetical protein V6N13_148709 [Hibiscus sabdariffa]|uniref:Transposase MuDR plant domain-containing protein n=1 Tax=Hibiscus sabdariffa TaxID=183260 RepID=A0ABR2EJK4_9ROSI